MNCQNDIDGDISECKDIDTLHEDDWDDEFKKDLECETESHTTSIPKSNLEEVIDLVIQDAIDYANSPENKRILPILTRKPNKGKSKSVSSTNTTNHNFANVQNPHQVSVANNSGLIISANINSQSPFHPIMQQNLTHNMQHVLQLTANGKGSMQLAGANTAASNMQHANIASQSQQQITNAMMGFTAAQLPNMIMPSYNSTVSSNYSQHTPNSQYSLPVSLSQIQLAQQQQSQLLLGNNQNSFADLSTTSNNPQQNLNFGVSGISSGNTQLMQSSYGNFGPNSSITVSPYQIPGMIQAYTSQTVADNSHQSDSQISTANHNANPTSVSCFLSSKTNNTPALTNNCTSSNQNSSSSAVASLYQTNAFDLQQQTLYAQQRLLQVQQQQQQANSAVLFPDYAAVMARYGGAYH